jgi:hypothetical protein
MPEPSASALNGFAGFELPCQERREEIRDDVARSLVDPGVPVDLPAEEGLPVRTFLSQNLGTGDVAVVVDDEGSSFTATAVLRLVELWAARAPNVPSCCPR